MTYTDGSCINSKDRGTPIGAATYTPTPCAGESPYCRINPSGEGLTCDINRAELAGIWGAVHQGRPLIATDSAVSLYQLQKALLHPMDLRFHKHRPAIEMIVESIQKNNNQVIKLLTIKAHASKIGNEMADMEAKAASTADVHDLVYLPPPPLDTCRMDTGS